MKIYIGADHRGYELKQTLLALLPTQGHEVVDCGNTQLDADDDYVVYAQEVGKHILNDTQAVGIVICGSGVGVDIASNRMRGVRAGLALSPAQVQHARENDHINVLALSSEFMGAEDAQACVESFLASTPLEHPRHIRRIAMLDEE